MEEDNQQYRLDVGRNILCRNVRSDYRSDDGVWDLAGLGVVDCWRLKPSDRSNYRNSLEVLEGWCFRKARKLNEVA